MTWKVGDRARWEVPALPTGGDFTRAEWTSSPFDVELVKSRNVTIEAVASNGVSVRAVGDDGFVFDPSCDIECLRPVVG